MTTLPTAEQLVAMYKQQGPLTAQQIVGAPASTPTSTPVVPTSTGGVSSVGLTPQQTAELQNIVNTNPGGQAAYASANPAAYPMPQISSQPATQQGNNQQQSQSGMPAQPTYTAPPTTPVLTGTDDKVLQAILDFQSSIKSQNEAVSAAQAEADAFEASRRTSYRDIEGQPIAMPFVTGQQSAWEKTYGDQGIALQNKLARLQAARQADLSLGATNIELMQGERGYAADIAQQQYMNEFNAWAAQNQMTGQQYQDALAAWQAQQPIPADTQVVEAGGRKLLVNSQTGQTIQDLGAASTGTGGTVFGNFTKEQASLINQVQDNARQDPAIKLFNDVRGAYEQGRAAYQKGISGEAPGVGDIVLMRTIAKVTDPTSSVREEEFATFQGAQAKLASYGIKLTKEMWSGDKLTDTGRDQLYGMLENIYSQRLAAYQNAQDYYNGQLKQYGITGIDAAPFYAAPESGGSNLGTGQFIGPIGMVETNPDGSQWKQNPDGSYTRIK